MDVVKQLRYDVVFDNNTEKINPLFSKVKIRIAYTGTNRNNSYISKEAFEKALPTIYNCPIVGEYIESIEDFKNHGGKIEISDEGIKYIQTTKPYGLIPESAEITWEDIVEEDGTVNTYLCATGYLWTGRYEEAETVIAESKGQSMEIEVVNGAMQIIDKKEVFAIEDFTFSAFCILGNEIEPCFESSEIMSYTLDKEQFKSEFTKMVAELRQFTLSSQSSIAPEVDDIKAQEGGNALVDEKMELLAKYNLTVEQLDFTLEDIELEELEVKLKEFVEQQEDESKEETKPVEFSATYRQKREALSNALPRKIEKDDDGNIVYEEYQWLADFDDSVVYVEKSIWTSDKYECKYGKYEYVFDEANLTATLTSDFIEMFLVWLTEEEKQQVEDDRIAAEANFNALQEEFNQYKEEYSTSNAEVDKLKEFKINKLAEERQQAEDSLFEQFTELNGQPEFETLKNESADYKLEELEKECFAILGRKNAKFTLVKPKPSKVVVPLSTTNTGGSKDKGDYDDIIGKYTRK